jgi:hypothetical protein
VPEEAYQGEMDVTRWMREGAGAILPHGRYFGRFLGSQEENIDGKDKGK